VMTKRQPTDEQRGDIDFGWPLLKQVGSLDIGQAIAVREAVWEILHFGTALEPLVDWLERHAAAPVHADPDRFLPMGPKTDR